MVPPSQPKTLKLYLRMPATILHPKFITTLNCFAELAVTSLQTWKEVLNWLSIFKYFTWGRLSKFIPMWRKSPTRTRQLRKYFREKLEVQLVFDTAITSPPSTNPLIEQALIFESPIYRSYIFFFDFYLYVFFWSNAGLSESCLFI